MQPKAALLSPPHANPPIRKPHDTHNDTLHDKCRLPADLPGVRHPGAQDAPHPGPHRRGAYFGDILHFFARARLRACVVSCVCVVDEMIWYHPWWIDGSPAIHPTHPNTKTPNHNRWARKWAWARNRTSTSRRRRAGRRSSSSSTGWAARRSAPSRTCARLYI